jgi:ABC-type branched-subunit amino acid transport system substrate-binding protein
MDRHIDRRHYLKGIGATGTAALAGCLGGGGDTPTETETESMDDGTTSTPTPVGRQLKLGILMGVTGGLAQLGPPIRDAAKVAVNQVNDADTNFSVDMQFEDTATDPNQGISGGEALSSAGYPAIVGALSSTVSIQVSKNVTTPNQIVQCSPASTSPAITGLNDNDFMWRTTPTDALQSKVMVQVGQQRLDASSTSYLALNNDYGQGLAQAYAQNWKDAGGSVLAEVAFEPNKSSYTSQLEQAMSPDPDLLMVVGYPESGVNIFRDFYADYSQDTPIIVPDGLKDSELPGNVGQDMSNVWGTAPLSTGPGKETFESMYKEQYGSSKVPFRAQSYDAAAVLLLANAAAGENSGSAIRDQMTNVAQGGGTKVTPSNLTEGLEMAAQGEDVTYQGASGVIEFSDAGDIAAATYELFRYTASGLETKDQIDYSA